jgi:preprotein translocase subunit SecA
MKYLNPGEDTNEVLKRAREGDSTGPDSEDDADGEMEYVGSGEEDQVTAPIHSDEQVGRNDPCPCGSGRKFKKCCGR